MTSTLKRQWTADELLTLPSDQRCELIEGEVIFLAPASYKHGRIAATIGAHLTIYVAEHSLGEVYAAETGFKIGHHPDTVRAPDAAFVAADRVLNDDRGFYPGPPDLAVEVVSPDESEDDVVDKVEQWLAAGAQLVWAIWPRTRSVTVHRRNQPQQTLHEADTLDGQDVVPGFQCGVANLFN